VIPFTDLKAQTAPIRGELERAWSGVLASGTYVLGEEVERFESEFSAYCDTAHAVATNSGTSALHLALLSLGVGPGDEVITVAHTFVATVEAIMYTGARPVLVDVDAGSLTLDPSALRAAISPRTRAVVAVHLYGRCADMDPICDIARRSGLAVVEDAAQAHGALYRGRRAGSIGHIGCFSFYPSKNLGACGEGGAVVTSDAAVAETVRRLRDHGQSGKYRHELPGFNYRMEALQGATLRVKLPHLDAWNAARRRLADEYRRRLGDGARLLPDLAWVTPVHHVFPVFHPDRDRLREHLLGCGVETAIHYPCPVHLQPAYRDLGYGEGDLPVTESACRHELSLPLYPEMSEAAVGLVADAVRRFPRGDGPRPTMIEDGSGARCGTGSTHDSCATGGPGVSVCFQAFNEERTVRQVLEEADQLLSGSGVDYEIILCDDGSEDSTGPIADEVASVLTSVRVLHHARNLGIAANLRELYAVASKPFVFIDSVDRQWPIEILPELLARTDRWDIIVASRKDKFYGPVRAFVSWGFNLLPRLLFGVRTFDAGATKLVRREALPLAPMVSRSPFLEAEVMIRAARARFRIGELPVDIRPRSTGRSHGVSAATVYQALQDVVRVRWALRGRSSPLPDLHANPEELR
jgi:dTDP-4-amino-4,6-dideoxygalactose transaminase